MIGPRSDGASPERISPERGWLLLRRHGGTWGVAHSVLRELTGCCLELESGERLMADELLDLAAGLETRPFPSCARAFYPEQVFGLALWRDQPVILLEPGAAPPACLRAPPEEPRAQQKTSTMDVDADEIR